MSAETNPAALEAFLRWVIFVVWVVVGGAGALFAVFGIWGRIASCLNDGEDEESDGRGLVCLFCGADGFDSQAALEEHIDGHPWVARRDNLDEDGGRS